MSKHTHERKRIVIQKAPIKDRDVIESRLESIGRTIHPPGEWYRRDVYRLLMMCDAYYTELLALKEKED